MTASSAARLRPSGSAAATKPERIRPLLKWAGGKTQLLSEILPRLPEKMGTYYEPFVGGGAVFFALATERRFERAVLGDANRDIATFYKAVRDDVDGVIKRLERFTHSEDEYYRIRASRPRTAAGKAARVLYLNRTGYNGLYRVNSRGEFNVPFGRYKNPNFLNEERLRAGAEALQGVQIEVSDFEKVCAGAKPGDAVYLDPPYAPVSRTSNFAHYDRSRFGEKEHQRLAKVFGALVEQGVCAVLSNSDTEITRGLYESFETVTVRASRTINSRADSRGAVREILVVARGGYAP